MDYRDLMRETQGIVMPDDMKVRILRNCRNQIEKREGKEMQQRGRGICVRKPVAAVAMVVCIICLAATALAVTGVLQGYFRDVVDDGGAIVGTTYEQADEEILITVRVEDDVLLVTVRAVDAGKAPYSEAEELALGAYQLLRADGTVAQDWCASEPAAMRDGRAEIRIALDALASGEYQLVIQELMATKKADQPLAIKGSWACAFSK